MPSAKNKRTPKLIDPKVGAVRNLKREIKKCEKKMQKLLKLYEIERPRWKVVNGKREDRKLRKFQGMPSGSKRHNALKSHIDRMKARLRDLT